MGRPLALILIAIAFGCETPFPPFLGPIGPPAPAPDPAGLDVTPARPEIRVGQAVTMRAVLTGAGSEQAAVSWSTLNPSVAQLSAADPACGDRCARVTGVTPGVSVVSAEAAFGGIQYSAQEVVTVSAQ